MHAKRGFALSELLIIVVILGILSSVVIVNTGRELNRERLNSVATGFAAWLQAIQAASGRQGQAGGCSVSVTPGASLIEGGTLASVTPAECSSESNFRIPQSFGAAARYNVSGPGQNSPVVFSPRGSVNITAADHIWVVELVGSDLRRCVQVTRGLGAVRVGVPSGNTCEARVF
jgi:type II secretory pathway pseudopilin PulG